MGIGSDQFALARQLANGTTSARVSVLREAAASIAPGQRGTLDAASARDGIDSIEFVAAMLQHHLDDPTLQRLLDAHGTLIDVVVRASAADMTSLRDADVGLRDLAEGRPWAYIAPEPAPATPTRLAHITDLVQQAAGAWNEVPAGMRDGTRVLDDDARSASFAGVRPIVRNLRNELDTLEREDPKAIAVLGRQLLQQLEHLRMLEDWSTAGATLRDHQRPSGALIAARLDELSLLASQTATRPGPIEYQQGRSALAVDVARRGTDALQDGDRIGLQPIDSAQRGNALLAVRDHAGIATRLTSAALDMRTLADGPSSDARLLRSHVYTAAAMPHLEAAAAAAQHLGIELRQLDVPALRSDLESMLRNDFPGATEQVLHRMRQASGHLEEVATGLAASHRQTASADDVLGAVMRLAPDDMSVGLAGAQSDIERALSMLEPAIADGREAGVSVATGRAVLPGIADRLDAAARNIERARRGAASELPLEWSTRMRDDLLVLHDEATRMRRTASDVELQEWQRSRFGELGKLQARFRTDQDVLTLLAGSSAV